jgi:hypothetical protein
MTTTTLYASQTLLSGPGVLKGLHIKTGSAVIYDPPSILNVEANQRLFAADSRRSDFTMNLPVAHGLSLIVDGCVVVEYEAAPRPCWRPLNDLWTTHGVPGGRWYSARVARVLRPPPRATTWCLM